METKKLNDYKNETSLEDCKEVYEKNCSAERKEATIIWDDKDCEFFKSCITTAISAGRDISNEENLEKLIQDCEKLVNDCILKMDVHDITTPHDCKEKLTRKENKILAGLVKSVIRY